MSVVRSVLSRRSRLRPAVLASLFAAACLTPTDNGSRYGEARLQPVFGVGSDPDAFDIVIDSMRTTIRHAGSADSPVVDTVIAFTGSGEHGWIVELNTAADEMDVTIELHSGGEHVYRGARSIMVTEGSIGRAEIEDIDVAYVGSALAARIEVLPAHVVFTVGGATRQLEAVAYTAAGAVLEGKAVSWASADPAVADVDDAGVVTAAGPGATTIIASADGVSGSASVLVDITLPQTTIITADPTTIVANGVATSTITVEVRNASGELISASAGTVALAATLGSLGDVTDIGDGTYTATLTAGGVTGSAIITGTLNDIDITDTAIVELIAGEASTQTTTITADPTSLVADGASTSLITVEVRDGHGNLVGASAGEVVLTPTLGTLSDPVDHGDGTYTATFTAGTEAGDAVITGTLNGAAIEDNATIVLTAGQPSTQTTTITANPTSLVADGASTSLIAVEVRDGHGNLVGASAGVVELITTLGTLSDVVDHGDGTYTATFTAGTVAGEAVITGTLNGVAIADNATIVLTAGEASTQTTTITADPTSLIADGVSTSVVTVEVRDENGNLIGTSASDVVLTPTLGSLADVVDNGDGTYTATFRAGTVAGEAVITGTLNGAAIDDNATIVLTAGEASTQTTTITANPTSLIADGVSTSTVTVQVRDENGNLVGASAGVVELVTTLGTLSDVVDHGDGTYTALLGSGTFDDQPGAMAAGRMASLTIEDPPGTGTAIVTGTLNGVAIDDAAEVVFKAGALDEGRTTIEADSSSLVAGSGATSLITVRVFDVYGNPLGASAGVATLSTTLGTIGEVTDVGDGTYTAVLTATAVAGDGGSPGAPVTGFAEIAGTLNGNPILNSTMVVFRDPQA